METSEQEQYYELSYSTLALQDATFIHQHIVDAYTAQTADTNTKPIGITFSLIGLHLYIDEKYTGKQVQQAHLKLAKKRKDWPSFNLPEQRGDIRVTDVLTALPRRRTGCDDI